ncbi:MAG: hypothetical protein ACPG4Q_01320 [Phycisphaeraceae bacterium]|jgi:hypothetical protein
MSDQPFNSEQKSALQQLRLRWVIALVINLPLPFIAMPIVGSEWLSKEPSGAAGQSMLMAVVLGAAALLVGHFSRNQAYKADWKGELIGPEGYVKGNTFFFAALTGGAIGLFLLSISGGWPAPTFAAAPIVIGLLIFNYPNGRPMQPAPPRLLDGDGL